MAFPAVLPWHTYTVDVGIYPKNSSTAVVSRSVNVSVVQPHIVAVKLGSATHEYTVPTGSVKQLLPLGGAFDRVSIQFNRDMDTYNNLATALSITRASTSYANIGVSTASNAYHWDTATHTATWLLSATMDLGKYALHLPYDLEDEDGNLLYNGWQNPGSLLDLHRNISAVLMDAALRDTDYAFDFRVLQGDIDADGVVGFADLGVLLNNYNSAQSSSDHYYFFAIGDLNGDGVVDFTDLGILLNRYNSHL
jgi:hypothetical protein